MTAFATSCLLPRETVNSSKRYIAISLANKRQTTKFSSANFQKMVNSSYIILRIQRLRAKSVDLGEVAHHEHQDLHCLQIQVFSSLVLKELKGRVC